MTVKLESHFIPVNDNIVEDILSYGDELNRSSPVRADHTRWRLHDHTSSFNSFIEKFNEIYPTYKINELWGATYRQGDYAEAHNHYGFDRAFVWFVDTHPCCNPLIFPNIKEPWLPHYEVIQPRNGMLYVFGGKDIHYVEPSTCKHPRIVMSGNLRKDINTEVSISNPWQ
tara:strand:+ start:84 stop:593 length:510 start_codon:yes stop_codon:yes gene_type:complete